MGISVKKIRKNGLKLNNDGDLSLFFVGSGSAFTKKYYQNNIIIIKGNDHLLVDCGTLCSLSLSEIDFPVTALRNIYLTHIHADHTGGMEEIFLMNRFFAKQKPNLILDKKLEKILWNETLKGGSGYSECINGRWLKLPDFVNIIRPDKDKTIKFRETLKADIGSLHLQFPRTRHIPDSAKSWKDAVVSYGVIIDKRIFFTSDTMFDRALVEEFDSLYHFEYIFHDCQLFTGGVHASIEELKTLPQEIRKKIILMHYGDNKEEKKNLCREYGFHSWAETHCLYTVK